MRFADRFTSNGQPRKPRTPAQEAADQQRRDDAAKARQRKVQRMAARKRR